MSFLNAFKHGVSELIRASSQITSQPTESGATIEEVIETENATINPELLLPTMEPEPMDIDGGNVVTMGETLEDGTSLQKNDDSHTSHLQNDVPTVNPVRSSSVPLDKSPLTTKKCGYVYDLRMLLHAPLQASDDHPEAPARIQGIAYKLKEGGLLNRMKLINARKVTEMEALLVHSEDHLQKINLIECMTGEQMAAAESYYEHLSLYVCSKTSLAAYISCGGVIEAALAVARGELEKCFAIVRPPGHHAEPEEHMGFCFFNNVAVAARVVQQVTPIKRILIVDWDVHHGNGTQRAFIDDPSVLYISIHRYDGGRFYPCGTFGGIDSCGEGAGEGMSVNIPWPEKGMGDAEYLHAFMRIVMPIAMEFAPELVIISSGFDAAEGDQLGECHVTPAGYAHMTHMLCTLAGGKVVVALEGGYNVESISNSALAVTRVLLGEAPPEIAPLVANEVGSETVWLVAKHQSKYWKSIDVKACEPKEEYPEQTISIPELLKAHRQEYLYSKYNMVEIPLLDSEVDERYQSQVISTPDIMEKETLVLLVHQFGELRVELAGTMTCDVNLEYSYLIDVTKDLVDWVHQKGYAYVEVNTYPKPPQSDRTLSWSELAYQVVTYLWDNYVLLSNAKNIILMGHGPGCAAVMDLMRERARGIMKKVKAVVLVVGRQDVPQTPKNEDELRIWYIKHSFVAVPKDHPFVLEGRLRKRHGKVTTYDEPKTIKLLSRALPEIRSFIEKKLPEPESPKTTTESTDVIS